MEAGRWGRRPGGRSLRAQVILVRESGATRERIGVDMCKTGGGDMSQVRGVKQEIQKRLKQVGQETRTKFVKIEMEPRSGAVPIRGWNTTTS